MENQSPSSLGSRLSLHPLFFIRLHQSVYLAVAIISEVTGMDWSGALTAILRDLSSYHTEFSLSLAAKELYRHKQPHVDTEGPTGII